MDEDFYAAEGQGDKVTNAEGTDDSYYYDAAWDFPSADQVTIDHPDICETYVRFVYNSKEGDLCHSWIGIKGDSADSDDYYGLWVDSCVNGDDDYGYSYVEGKDGSYEIKTAGTYGDEYGYFYGEVNFYNDETGEDEFFYCETEMVNGEWQLVHELWNEPSLDSYIKQCYSQNNENGENEWWCPASEQGGCEGCSSCACGNCYI